MYIPIVYFVFNSVIDYFSTTVGGVVNWPVLSRTVCSQTHPVGDGQLAMQLQRLVDGKPLVSNGPRPAATDEVEAEEEEDGTDVDSADSDGLML